MEKATSSMTYLPQRPNETDSFRQRRHPDRFPHAMWGGWITALARQASGAQLCQCRSTALRAGRLRRGARREIDAGAPLAIGAMAELYALTVEVLLGAGLARASAEAAAKRAWYIPDPVALAKPLAELPALFKGLGARGRWFLPSPPPTTARRPRLRSQRWELRPCSTGWPVATTASAIETGARRGAQALGQLGIAPAQAAVVGDTAADLRSHHAAGAALAIGVLSGVGSRELLGPLADVLLPSVAGLMEPVENC